MNKRKQRTYIIVGLCAVLVVMAIGYAAFSSLLTINGAASTTNSWCLGFDQTKTNTYTVTKGVQTGQTPTGSMSYSGTACQTNYVPTASISSVFYQPGDQIEYTFTIKNASTVTAAIKSILIDNQSVTSDTTITKGNIQYIVKMPTSTTLAANAETTMKVTAKFQNDTPISGNYSGETQEVQVKINAEQDDGNGGMAVPYTGTIYRFNNIHISSWGTHAITNLTKGTDYITAEDYPTPASRATALGHYYYLKHDIVNDEVTHSYVCFITDTEHCMEGKATGTPINANVAIIQGYQAYYNIPTGGGSPGGNSGCSYSAYGNACYGTKYYSIVQDGYSSYNFSGEQVFIQGAEKERCEVTMGESYCHSW